jgi:RNA polymerase-binding transcription factor DksA
MTLSEEFLAQQRVQLEEQLQVAEKEIERLQEFMLGEVDVDAEEGDPDLFEREKVAALIISQERAVDAARQGLKAIDAGSYGICERCKEPIPEERLEVRPEAALCVKCQGEVERIARRGQGSRPVRW